MKNTKLPSNLRGGFTLAELMVTMAIIIVIFGMGALFMNGFATTERSHTGAARLQQWLLISRQRALLDRAPRGVRLFRDPNNLRFFNKGQYIEQPDDFTGGSAQSDLSDTTNKQVLLTGVDISDGHGRDMTLWPVQEGDYFQANGAGLMRQIERIEPGANNTTWKLHLVSGLIYPINTPTKIYRIVRRPRALGEEALVFPSDVAVDLEPNSFYGKPLPINGDGTLDILFAPDGMVLGNNVSDSMIFWVREKRDKERFRGDPSLIVVFIRSGLVESYPVDLSNNRTNPFSLIK